MHVKETAKVGRSSGLALVGQNGRFSRLQSKRAALQALANRARPARRDD
jgi:hypothetical protein